MDRFIASKPTPRRATLATSHTVIIASHSIEHQIFNLRSRGILVTATEARHSANPLLVGHALEKELRLPPHQVRVTRHHLEAFFVLFDVPSHRDRAITLGRLPVDGSTFLLQAWRESEHAVLQTYSLHVRVCVKRMPLHLWSIEGAQDVLRSDVLVDRLDSHTYDQESTEFFSCWVWCRNLNCIPGHHSFSDFPQGAGRVAEMNGFLPPRREVAPPPEGLLYNALIHIDLAEDWMVHAAHTPSTGQSGVSSSNAEEARPYPEVQPFTSHFGVLDGEERSYGGRRYDGCRDVPAYQRRHDDGDSSEQQRRNWRDAVAAPARNRGATPTPTGRDGNRHRSRTPAGYRQRAASPSSSTSPAILITEELLPPPPPLPTSGPRPQRLSDLPPQMPTSAPESFEPAAPHVPDAVLDAGSACATPISQDPLNSLVFADQPTDVTWASSGVNPMCMELEAACVASLFQPLSFQASPS
ncbi:hypothetical protein ACQ4PT_045303 [Festuca glaucescens]